MSESDTKRNGPFSTYIEIHAFVIGMYAGYIDYPEWRGIDGSLEHRDDFEAEKHYGEGGYLLGAILRLATEMLRQRVLRLRQ